MKPNYSLKCRILYRIGRARKRLYVTKERKLLKHLVKSNYYEYKKMARELKVKIVEMKTLMYFSACSLDILYKEDNKIHIVELPKMIHLQYIYLFAREHNLIGQPFSKIYLLWKIAGE